MVLGKPSSSRSDADKRPGRKVYLVAILAAMLGLGACNPVETFRDWTGASKNDPDPELTPNTGNLAAGEASEYPNLATVPPPPNRALTAAEREKLTQSLIADASTATPAPGARADRCCASQPRCSGRLPIGAGCRTRLSVRRSAPGTGFGEHRRRDSCRPGSRLPQIWRSPGTRTDGVEPRSAESTLDTEP